MSITKSLKISSKIEHRDPLIQDIVRARKSQRFTQGQLAEMSGVSRRTIVLIEAGGDCTLFTLQRVTAALGLRLTAQVKHIPTLDDVTRENEALFASARSSQLN
jgi:DNA-binding XRE family transcriptional regulator